MKEVISGVPLAQYAAVTAALAEAFPLRAVLAIEGINPACWAEADHGWTEQLAEDAALMARYQTELAAAQSRLLPQEDPAPKKRAGKLKLVASGAGVAPAPATMGEPPKPPIQRAAPEAPPPVPSPPAGSEPRPALQSSEDLAAPKPPSQASYLPAGRQVTLLAVEVPTAVLPFRAAPAITEDTPAPPAPHPRAGRQVTLLAVEVPTAVLPFQAARAATAPAPPSAQTAHEGALAAPPLRGPGEPRPQSSDDAGTLVGFELPIAFLPFQPAPVMKGEISRPPAPPAAAAVGRQVTVTAVGAPTAFLPFRASDPKAQPAVASPAVAAPEPAQATSSVLARTGEPGKPPTEDLRRTLDISEVPSAFLPFRAAASAMAAGAPEPAPAPASAGELGKPPVEDLRATMEPFHVPIAVFPFRATPSPELQPDNDRPAPPPSEGLPAPENRETVRRPPTPPFGSARVMPSEDERTAIMTLPVPRRRAAAAEEAPIPEAAFKASSLDEPDSDDPAARTGKLRPSKNLAAAAPEPTTGSFPSGGWGFLRAPSPEPSPVAQSPMPLDRHASLCLEIAVDPARAAEALARHQVSAAEKQRADEHYRARMSADPELCARWNRAYEEAYHAWYKSRP